MSEKVGNMDLSAIEIDMILKHRTEQAQKKKVKEQTIAILDIAATYGAWLLETGNGSTYNTFCDDCDDIDTSVLQDRSKAYNFIMGIIQLATNYATEKGTETCQ